MCAVSLANTAGIQAQRTGENPSQAFRFSSVIGAIAAAGHCFLQRARHSDILVDDAHHNGAMRAQTAHTLARRV